MSAGGFEGDYVETRSHSDVMILNAVSLYLLNSSHGVMVPTSLNTDLNLLLSFACCISVQMIYIRKLSP